eukprot:GHRQ01036248.1.p1 GENE.GHRQ01036248.1~~GHRQ01036248.1.p1  ORF type:complete len:113 (+),score=9.33 GHRQ01036248.1:93-431(+)
MYHQQGHLANKGQATSSTSHCRHCVSAAGTENLANRLLTNACCSANEPLLVVNDAAHMPACCCYCRCSCCSLLTADGGIQHTHVAILFVEVVRDLVAATVVTHVLACRRQQE